MNRNKDGNVESMWKEVEVESEEQAGRLVDQLKFWGGGGGREKR